MRVDRYNYPAQFNDGVPELVERIGELLLRGDYILSDEVSRFEAAFAAYVGSSSAVGVNSGTDALYLTLGCLGVGPGDEVITQANTFYATVAAVVLTGGKPVLVDADSSTFLLDQQQVEAAIGPATRVLMPVHLYGKPTPMAELIATASRHGFDIVEDAAQAHGARVEGRQVGTFGRAGCFSFHPSKNLAAAGDAGAVVTDDDDLARMLRRRRQLGQHHQNDHVDLGINSKLDAVQAIILSGKLARLDTWNEQRRLVAGWYRERLVGLPVYLQRVDTGETHVYHLFQVGTPDRDRLLAHLQASGVDATVRYPVPIHLQPAFSDCGWRPGQFPVAERLSRELLCLPIRPDMSVAEVDYVTSTVERFFGC